MVCSCETHEKGIHENNILGLKTLFTEACAGCRGEGEPLGPFLRHDSRSRSYRRGPTAVHTTRRSPAARHSTNPCPARENLDTALFIYHFSQALALESDEFCFLRGGVGGGFPPRVLKQDAGQNKSPVQTTICRPELLLLIRILQKQPQPIHRHHVVWQTA